MNQKSGPVSVRDLIPLLLPPKEMFELWANIQALFELLPDTLNAAGSTWVLSELITELETLARILLAYEEEMIRAGLSTPDGVVPVQGPAWSRGSEADYWPLPRPRQSGTGKRGDDA